MRRHRSYRKADPAILKGVTQALQKSFDAIEDEADAEMRRLIEQMKSFEGTGK